jgi:hypothetical protein
MLGMAVAMVMQAALTRRLYYRIRLLEYRQKLQQERVEYL